ARAAPVGGAEERLQAAAGGLERDGHPLVAQARRERERRADGTRLERQHDRVDPRHHGLARRDHREPLEPEREADSRDVGPRERGDEPIVAPAPADGVLRAESTGDDLERRPAVVVEPADETWVHDIRDPFLVEQRADLVEVHAARLAQAVEHYRGAPDDGAAALDLAVEDAERVT